MSSFYLVRHGITPANQENRFAGRTGEALHREGVAQIKQVAERLPQLNIATVYCGPARRTLQSAAIIGARLGVPVIPLAEFDEILIPHWDGLTKDEIRRRHGAQYPTWLAEPQNFRLPGCETLAQVQKRAAAAVERLRAGSRDQPFLVVSHLIVLRCLVLYYRGLDLKDFRTIKIDNGAIVRITGSVGSGMSVNFLP